MQPSVYDKSFAEILWPVRKSWCDTLDFLQFLPGRLYVWWLKRKYDAVFMYPNHFGHQAGDVEYDMRTRPDATKIYLAGIVPNKALRKMHERYVTIRDISGWWKRYLVRADWVERILDDRLSRDLRKYSVGYEKYWKGGRAMAFDESEIGYGEMVLKSLGLEPGKFVCLHARDDRYGVENHLAVMEERGIPAVMNEGIAYNRHRNMEFATYFDAIDWLKTQGLKAVRIGSAIKQPYDHDNLIDYASMRNTFTNPDLLDLYLLATCKIYVGNATGITMAASIFNTPGAAVNWYPYFPASRPQPTVKICRVKRIKYQGRVLTDLESRHVFELATWDEIYIASQSIEVIDNTSEEILSTVQNALNLTNALSHAA